MKDVCKQAVARALGKATLTAQEATDIEQRIIGAQRTIARQDITAWRNMSDVDRLNAAAKQVAIDIQEAFDRKKKIAAQDIVTQFKNLQALNHPTLPASEVIDRMTAAHGDMSGIQSIDTKARAIATTYKAQIYEMYGSIKGALGVLTDKDLVQAIVRERFNQDTGNATAKKLAADMGEMFEQMRQRFNRAGGDIGKLDDWGLPQTHDRSAMVKSGKDGWIASVLPKVDRSKYVKEDGALYSDMEMQDLLSYAYTSITTNGANKIELGKPSYTGNSKVTNRHSDSRVLHFKDADAWLDYQNDFGGLPFVDLVDAHIATLSKEIALVETLGSNPKLAYKILQDAAKNIDTGKGIDIDSADKTLRRAQSMYDEFTGANMPESETLANLGMGYRALNVASMLGSTVLSSVTDQAMIAKTAHVHGLTWRKYFGAMIEQMNPANTEDRNLARSLGLGIDELTQAVNRFSDDGLTNVSGKAKTFARLSSAAATQVMRVSLMNMLNAANKTAVQKILMNKYGELSRSKTWEQLDEVDRELMQGTGLSERAWNVMRLAEPVIDRKGRQLLAAQSIYKIPDEKLKEFGDPQKVRDEVATQLTAHLLDEQGMAVIEAGIRERTILTGGTKKGSVGGEILRSILQFKSFSAALLLRHGSRAMSKKTGHSKVPYGMTLIAMTTMLGGLAVQLKELANGNDPLTVYDEDDPQKGISFLTKAFVAGGGLPFIGDVIVAGADPSGRDITSFMMGPIGSDIKAIAGLTVGNLNQAYEGKDTNAANEAFKLVKSKLPAQNLWYTKAATNRMIFDEIQDMLAPGYRERIKRKAEAEQGRASWLGDDWGDIREPDFERVVE